MSWWSAADLHLGPKAVVEGNAVSVWRKVTLDPGASVQGSIDEAVFPWAGHLDRPGLEQRALVDRIGILGIGVQAVSHDGGRLVLTLVAPGWIGTISGRSAGASILTGLAVEVLFVPALVILMVALTVSIIGIPLLASDSLPAGRVRRSSGLQGSPVWRFASDAPFVAAAG